MHRKINKINSQKSKEIQNYYNNFGMKDPIKELSSFILPGLKHLGTNVLKNLSKIRKKD